MSAVAPRRELDPERTAPPRHAGQGASWWRCEPRRLARDQREVATGFPALTWIPEGAGRWEGHLPRWPFSRPEPEHVGDLVGEYGLQVVVAYGHAYPMVPPAIHPLDPRPELVEWTVHEWHVLGDGSLCLLQTDALWDPRTSITDLLVKAAGWRIEYAMMKTGTLEAMSVHGIVSDPTFDHLIPHAARTTTAAAPPAAPAPTASAGR